MYLKHLFFFSLISFIHVFNIIELIVFIIYKKKNKRFDFELFFFKKSTYNMVFLVSSLISNYFVFYFYFLNKIRKRRPNGRRFFFVEKTHECNLIRWLFWYAIDVRCYEWQQQQIYVNHKYFVWCHKNEEFYSNTKFDLWICSSICNEKFPFNTHIVNELYRYQMDEFVHLYLHNAIGQGWLTWGMGWRKDSHYKLTNTILCFYFRFFWHFLFSEFIFFATTKKTFGLNKILHINFIEMIYFLYFFPCSVPQSYVYGSPYLGAATTASAAGLVPIPATQLSHAAAIAAATNQFYEYQVSANGHFGNIFKSYLWHCFFVDNFSKMLLQPLLLHLIQASMLVMRHIHTLAPRLPPLQVCLSSNPHRKLKFFFSFFIWVWFINGLFLLVIMMWS